MWPAQGVATLNFTKSVSYELARQPLHNFS